MKRTILIIVAIFILGLSLTKAEAEAKSVANFTEVLASDNIVLANAKNDPRVGKLEGFLNNYKSPLAEYSFYFIYCADKYGIDWKLLPAITGIESTFGKRIPSGSYNAYGWGNGLSRFESWEESIDYVTKALAEKYVARGLDTPREISPVYCPPNPTWGSKVEHFMAKIEEFNKDKPEDEIFDELLSKISLEV